MKLFIFALLFPISLLAENVTPTYAQTLLEEKEPPQVIDIRTKKEFDEGHIKGAKQIDFFGTNFEKELDKLDKKKRYIMHCKSGGRSGKSLSIWKKLGFKQVYHLNTGFDGWKAAELPVEKTKPKPKSEK